jgi:hypothetical protein
MLVIPWAAEHVVLQLVYNQYFTFSCFHSRTWRQNILWGMKFVWLCRLFRTGWFISDPVFCIIFIVGHANRIFYEDRNLLDSDADLGQDDLCLTHQSLVKIFRTGGFIYDSVNQHLRLLIHSVKRTGYILDLMHVYCWLSTTWFVVLYCLFCWFHVFSGEIM